jgi:hypothetical protein
LAIQIEGDFDDKVKSLEQAIQDNLVILVL